VKRNGLLAEKIIEVERPDVAEVFLGRTKQTMWVAVLLPGGGADARDPGIRTIPVHGHCKFNDVNSIACDEGAALAMLGRA